MASNKITKFNGSKFQGWCSQGLKLSQWKLGDLFPNFEKNNLMYFFYFLKTFYSFTTQATTTIASYFSFKALASRLPDKAF